MKRKNKPNETELQKKRKYWVEQGKLPEEITYGMLSEGFQSISGIPDDFCSAEDPDHRRTLWDERRPYIHDSYHEGEYRGYGEWRD